jgi:C-terminal processing protease CtpA/Prc
VINRFHPRHGEVLEFKTSDLGDRSYGVTRPVFVLTSGETFSGGEELSYDLQASRRAVLIGERTGGGANPARVLPLRHGFAAQIPFAQPINPITGKNWEGVGVTPDVTVPAERALDEALVRARAAAAQRRSSGPSASSGPSPSSARAPSTR